MRKFPCFINISWLLITILTFFYETKYQLKCDAAPTVSSDVVNRNLNTGLLETKKMVNITRQYDGDIFNAIDSPICNLETCMKVSGGTAGFLSSQYKVLDSEKILMKRNDQHKPNEVCNCRCLPTASVYREDIGICIDDISECTLSAFAISGSSLQKIPFVFLPLRGQIIHPSREINFLDIQTPICAVTGSQYLTSTGWIDLKNPIDLDFPFRMFRDEGRTFLQWLGEADLRYKMQGRIILIHLMCRDMSFKTNINSSEENSLNKIKTNIFSPCVAFRVSGSPIKYLKSRADVSEVSFQSEVSSNYSASSKGTSAKEYIAICVCSLLLGFIYVASVFLYIYVKKKKKVISKQQITLGDFENDINYPKNSQVTFAVPFNRNSSIYSTSSMNGQSNSKRLRNGKQMKSVSSEDIEVVKNNPLLKHFQNLSDQSGFCSDRSNSNSECEDTNQKMSERVKKNQTLVVIHPSGGCKLDNNLSTMVESPSSQTQDNECIPEENVSVVEDLGPEEKLETMRAVVSGSIRKKLYFNPAYFEPQLLMSPPPAAIEFLTKIREVITIAKYKMATKKYQPSLIMIPEEIQLIGLKNYFKKPMEYVSLCSNNCTEDLNSNIKSCSNCGDKHSSIQRWLETVPSHGKSNFYAHLDSNSGFHLKENYDELYKVYESSSKALCPSKAETLHIPTIIPKIISNSLKQNIAFSFSSCKKNQNLQISKESSPQKVISTLKHFNNSDMYTFTETSSEIYNNPKFSHLDSPQLSQKSYNSRNETRLIREKLNATISIENKKREYYEMLQNMKKMPDMVYEALAKDYSMGIYGVQKLNSKNTNNANMKNIKDLYNNTHNNLPLMITNDYSTLGKKPLRQYQPDSPIYRRKSPQYLIVDYETDSLERAPINRNRFSSSSPSSNNSSDVSSQPSPSLSTALPLEEEVEIRNTVYDKVEGSRKDGDSIIEQKVSKNYEDFPKSTSNKYIAPRIIYDTPFLGSMTIEVKHEPIIDALSLDCDQFEPDTLDRKPKRNSYDIKNTSEYLKSKRNLNAVDDEQISYLSLEKMTSLPDFMHKIKNQIVLRSTNSFRSYIEKSTNSQQRNSDDFDVKCLEEKPNFGSLREIYQSKTQRNVIEPNLANIHFSENGRNLTLQAKHSKRQRQNLEDDIVLKIMPPDVVPSEKNIYETLKFNKKNNLPMPKNFKGWNIDDFKRSNKININDNNYASNIKGNIETINNHNQSIEITAVLDTQKKSDLNENVDNVDVENNIMRQLENQNCEDSQTTENPIRVYTNNIKKANEEIMKNQNDEHNTLKKSGRQKSLKLLCQNENYFLSNSNTEDSFVFSEKNYHKNIHNVYRVQVFPQTNGMQIAMGLKNHSKKSKDLKNTIKKYFNLAASNFHINVDKKIDNIANKCKNHPNITLTDYFMNEDKSCINISDKSINVHNPNQTLIVDIKNSEDFLQKYRLPLNYSQNNTTLSQKLELDSGYMSTDSSEIFNQRVYERCKLELSDKDKCVELNEKKKIVKHIEHKSYQKEMFNSVSDENELCNKSIYSMTETDEDCEITEEMSESGAESVETHSFLFQNIKN